MPQEQVNLVSSLTLRLISSASASPARAHLLTKRSIARGQMWGWMTFLLYLTHTSACDGRPPLPLCLHKRFQPMKDRQRVVISGAELACQAVLLAVFCDI